MSNRKGRRVGIDWNAYASQYDVLAAHNPSYQDNIALLRNTVKSLELSAGASVCDIGAGTGNFICAIASDLPDVRFTHIDADVSMNQIARQKYAEMGLTGVTVDSSSIFDAEYPPESFDLIVCVNALYAMTPQREALGRMKTWLKPSGTLFLIDYGRQVKLVDWTLYILRNVARERGSKAAFEVFRRNLESIRQNRRGSQGQANGVYWLHSTDRFGQILREEGFQVDELRPCYRGYSDLAICTIARPFPSCESR